MPPLATGDTAVYERGASIVSLVAALIEEAYAARASDIHIDPTAAGTRVRIRVDGALADRHLIPKGAHGELIARLKILSGLRTDEHNAAQDGRFRYPLPRGVALDLRLSVMPTYHGENAVLRLLPSDEKPRTLAELGFDAGCIEAMEHALRHTSGLILATGPTGSGKTTTLYTLVGLLNTPGRSIVTIEDPIEYAIEGVRQIPVNPRTGLTFASGLRSLLRQDPDVLMVGEIRDAETASLAINTALTGHLVLSTLHTTDAATSVPRLLDMKVEPYLIASTLRLAVAQRLVRKCCGSCAGNGCADCSEGYKGRAVIAEVLTANDPVRAAIGSRASARELRALAREAGMRTMLEDGTEKAAEGLTTTEEVLRAIHE